MSHETNRAYYARRAAEEIAVGDKADGSSIAAIHFELAYRYSLLAEGQAMSRRSIPSSDCVDASQRLAWSNSAPVHNLPWPRG